MHLEVLVEEQSAEAALNTLLPRLLGEGNTFRIHPFQGKRDLLQKLPNRLRGYAKWLPPDARILVLVDRDQQDCLELKCQLESFSWAAGLATKSTAGHGFVVANRIAVEELEAWFLGDVDALVAAYPGVPPTLANRKNFRDPDAVRGGTAEELARVLRRAGHYGGALPKIEVARRISTHMIPERNRSRSFRVFLEAIAALSG